MVGDEIEEVVWVATQGFVGQQRGLDFSPSAIRRHGRVARREALRSDLCFMLPVTLAVLWRIGARVEAGKPIRKLFTEAQKMVLVLGR